MRLNEIAELVEQYRLGLEAQLALLRQLAALAERQRDSTGARDFERLSSESDERDRVTGGLMAVEEGLSEVRRRLSGDKELASATPGWAEVVRLRQEASELVSGVLSLDRESLKALADADTARRAALVGLEKGETTLVAYRRVLTPPVEHAALVDRRG